MQSRSGYDSLASTSLNSHYLNDSGRISTYPPSTPYLSRSASTIPTPTPFVRYVDDVDSKYNAQKIKLQQDIARKEYENQQLAQNRAVFYSTPPTIQSSNHLRPPTAVTVHRSHSSPNLPQNLASMHEPQAVHHIDSRALHKRIFQDAWENVMSKESNRYYQPETVRRDHRPNRSGYIPASQMAAQSNIRSDYYDQLDSPILKPKKLRPTKTQKKINKTIRSLSATREKLERDQIRVANAIEGHYYDSYLLESEDEANEKYMAVSGQAAEDRESLMISSDEVIRRFLEKQT